MGARMIAMKKADFALLSSLYLALFWITGAPAAAEEMQTLTAATANDVINDMLIANRTRKPTTIRLAPGHYLFGLRTFTSRYDSSFLPVVSTPIRIIGKDPDPAKTIFDVDPSSESSGRFFTVLRSGNLSVYNLTIKSGNDACSLDDCTQVGGGAAFNAGELSFHNCVLQKNISYEFQGGPNGGGGAIFNRGLLVLVRTTVTDNGTETQGGGIVFLEGAGSIWDSTISGNGVGLSSGDLASGSAGAMLIESPARVDIHNSTISGNSGGDPKHDEGQFSAPGIENHGIMTMTGSSVTENFAENPGVGGGILNTGSMRIENSTIGGNSGADMGGGIFNSGHLQLQGVTVTGNGGGGILNTPDGTVIMATTAIGGNNGNDCNGVLISKGHNAVSDPTDCTLTPSPLLGGRPPHDLVNLDLGLGQLEDNGVPGNGHYAPLAGSPLIDSGGAVGPTCTELDQLAQRRVDGDNDRDGANICDIGAVEFRP